MWPAPVEEVARFFREAGIDARLEELPSDEETHPGPGVDVEAFDCEGGRRVVAVVPAGAQVDHRKLPCAYPRPAAAPAFPFRGAVVLVERSVLAEADVWIEAGSPRHVAIVASEELVHLTGGKSVDLITARSSGNEHS